MPTLGPMVGPHQWGDYENKPPIYWNFMEQNKCIRTNGKLENGLMYLY